MVTKASFTKKASLVNFFVYCTRYGQEEGDEYQKVLYYYPPEASEDSKIRTVGLAEAVIRFTGTFNCEHPCEYLTTKKTKQYFYEPEPDFWMAMTIGIPVTEKVKDGVSVPEYCSEDVWSNVYRSILIQSYEMFRFFMGTFESVLTKVSDDVNGLKSRLEHFYSKYVLTMELEHASLLDAIHGLIFLPLDRQNFLKIHCLVNLLEEQYPCARHVVFLYNEMLVWSGLEQKDMQVFYRYLTTNLFPSCAPEVMNSGRMTPQAGRFLLGPPDVKEEENFGKIPHVILHAGPTPEELQLVIYKLQNACICIFIDGTCRPGPVCFPWLFLWDIFYMDNFIYPTDTLQLTMDFFRKLEAFLLTHAPPVVEDVTTQQAKRLHSAAPDQHFKYVYFNRTNLAQKNTVIIEPGDRSSGGIPVEALRLLPDLHSDLHHMGTRVEIAAKMTNDYWVVAKLSDSREFYVVLNQKSASLLEITEEVQKLCRSQFNNIFFVD
ncbi:unnamed protein product [Darwinula stevensoni]|uniref:Vacuolar fusion protein CCZ1 homolog n=1 Tax=Darwinula stevensoni TaxID=69355 RepID=A0A7R9A2Y7_9CRUS|nr:unnamed protein product [Darwinula stevensoni]CAG0880990.1 unnamed protein product [Darwinula stevensoni]